MPPVRRIPGATVAAPLGVSKATISPIARSRSAMLFGSFGARVSRYKIGVLVLGIAELEDLADPAPLGGMRRQLFVDVETPGIGVHLHPQDDLLHDRSGARGDDDPASSMERHRSCGIDRDHGEQRRVQVGRLDRAAALHR